MLSANRHIQVMIIYLIIIFSLNYVSLITFKFSCFSFFFFRNTQEIHVLLLTHEILLNVF